MKWFRNLLGQTFEKAHRTEPAPAYVIYAGEDSDISMGRNAFEFGIYVTFDNKDFTWLPCVTYEAEVIEQLRTMEEGQSFFITAEDPDYRDPIGTCVTAIEYDETLPKYDPARVKAIALSL